jgi:hypothetical protein
MRKIKNFKVNLCLKEISYAVKRLVNNDDTTISEVKETIQRCSRFYVRFLSPAVVYETFSKETLPFACEKTTPSKCFAESVFFVTIGNDLCEEYKKNEEAFGKHTGEIVSAISVDALRQSKNFVQRLILNEAKAENCEISKVLDIPRNLYGEFAKIIHINKIGISVESGNFQPKYSFCGLFYWIPSRKKAKK